MGRNSLFSSYLFGFGFFQQAKIFRKEWTKLITSTGIKLIIEFGKQLRLRLLKEKIQNKKTIGMGNYLGVVLIGAPENIGQQYNKCKRIHLFRPYDTEQQAHEASMVAKQFSAFSHRIILVRAVTLA